MFICIQSKTLFQESVPVPGEGEFVDLNTTDCCSPSWGHPEAGDHTHHCDTVLQRDRRTLVVRRRTTAEMTSILQDSSWLESIYIVSDLLSEANHPCEHCHHARVLLTSIMTFLCGYFKSWQEINEKSATKWYIGIKELIGKIYIFKGEVKILGNQENQDIFQLSREIFLVSIISQQWQNKCYLNYFLYIIFSTGT